MFTTKNAVTPRRQPQLTEQIKNSNFLLEISQKFYLYLIFNIYFKFFTLKLSNLHFCTCKAPL